jgi:hypothetical protein
VFLFNVKSNYIKLHMFNICVVPRIIKSQNTYVTNICHQVYVKVMEYLLMHKTKFISLDDKTSLYK